MGDLIERREPDANENPWKRSKARVVAQAADELSALRERVAALEGALATIANDPYQHGQRVQKMKSIARAILAKQGGEDV